jgi:ribosomal protein S18 acetylase RimI-like enzyme
MQFLILSLSKDEGVTVLAPQLHCAGVIARSFGNRSILRAMEIRSARETDEAEVTALWRACGLVVPYNDPAADFRLARGKANSDVLVGEDAGAIVAAVMVGHDGHRGWIYYLAVAPERQGHGLGREIVRAAEAWLAARGIAKLQLMVRKSNAPVLRFYETLGFEQSQVVVMQRWLKRGG